MKKESRITRGVINDYARHATESFRTGTALVLPMLVLALAGAAVPAQAITPTTIYAFPSLPGPINPNIEAIAQGRDGNLYLTAGGGTGGGC